jgi:hypothetical protein
MNELCEMLRRIVREELASRRGPQLASVTALSAHESADDTANYEVDVRLKHDGLELAKVPLLTPHVGWAAPPRVGDLVLVEFVDHDLQQPLVTGCFYHDQDRAPLFTEDDVLFEQRVPDGTRNHLRFASDGSIFLQRDVKKLEDNSDFKAGIRIDPDGLIELKASDELTITLDQQNGKIAITCKGKPIDISCQTLTLTGDLVVTDGGAKTTISGNRITGG